VKPHQVARGTWGLLKLAAVWIGVLAIGGRFVIPAAFGQEDETPAPTATVEEAPPAAVEPIPPPVSTPVQSVAQAPSTRTQVDVVRAASAWINSAGSQPRSEPLTPEEVHSDCAERVGARPRATWNRETVLNCYVETRGISWTEAYYEIEASHRREILEWAPRACLFEDDELPAMGPSNWDVPISRIEDCAWRAYKVATPDEPRHSRRMGRWKWVLDLERETPREFYWRNQGKAPPQSLEWWVSFGAWREWSDAAAASQTINCQHVAIAFIVRNAEGLFEIVSGRPERFSTVENMLRSVKAEHAGYDGIFIRQEDRADVILDGSPWGDDATWSCP